jgi:hypothetical protein
MFDNQETAWVNKNDLREKTWNFSSDFARERETLEFQRKASQIEE